MNARDVVHHRVQCAAIVNGCDSVLMWVDGTLEPMDTRLLLVNGWRLAHGHWICARHE